MVIIINLHMKSGNLTKQIFHTKLRSNLCKFRFTNISILIKNLIKFVFEL